MLVAYFSATANARPAIIGSLLRGAVAIGVMCDCTFHDFGNEWRVAVFPDIRNDHSYDGSSDSWQDTRKAGKRMNTFDIMLQQVGLFVIYILAGVLLVRTRVLSCETLEPISKFVLENGTCR